MLGRVIDIVLYVEDGLLEDLLLEIGNVLHVLQCFEDMEWEIYNRIYGLLYVVRE
jgi:hypothetical protein